MVLHFANGAHAFVNDIQMGIALVKEIHAVSEKPSSRTTSSRIGSTLAANMTTDASSFESLSPRVAGAAGAHRQAPPGLKLRVKNTFLHAEKDGEIHSNASALSAPARCDSVGYEDFFIGDATKDNAAQTEHEIPHIIDTPANCGEASVFKPPVERVDTTGRWESLVGRAMCVRGQTSFSDRIRSGRDDVAKEKVWDAERMDAWVPTGQLADKIVVGDVVRIDQRFSTADDLQVMLESGTKGVVEQLDEDGDAQIRIPFLSGLRCSLRWVVAADFPKMSICRRKLRRRHETQ